MKGITLTQPWASLVAGGWKVWETRGWPTEHRGELLIHAAKSFPDDAREFAASSPFVRQALQGRAPPTGVVLALVELTACLSTREALRQKDLLGQRELALGNFGPDRYAFHLENCRRLRSPIAWRGAPGLWAVPPELQSQVEAQLAHR